MKDKEIVRRSALKGKLPEKIYEVYDSTDTNHQIIVYSGDSKEEAIKAGRKYIKDYGINPKCMECFELERIK